MMQRISTEEQLFQDKVNEDAGRPVCKSAHW